MTDASSRPLQISSTRVDGWGGAEHATAKSVPRASGVEMLRSGGALHASPVPPARAA